MSYAKLEDGHLRRPPRNGFAEDGTPISGYRWMVENDESFRIAEGWLPLVETDPPEHDEETHRARRTGWEEVEGEIVSVWEIVERPPDPEQGDHLDPEIGAPDA